MCMFQMKTAFYILHYIILYQDAAKEDDFQNYIQRVKF
jgi:hypothetical protein